MLCPAIYNNSIVWECEGVFNILGLYFALPFFPSLEFSTKLCCCSSRWCWCCCFPSPPKWSPSSFPRCQGCQCNCQGASLRSRSRPLSPLHPILGEIARGSRPWPRVVAMQQWWLLAVRYTHKLPGYPALPAATTTNRAGSQTLWKIIGEERWTQQKIRRFLRRKRCHQCNQYAANIAQLSSKETSLTTLRASNGLIALLFKQGSQKKYVIFQIKCFFAD